MFYYSLEYHCTNGTFWLPPLGPPPLFTLLLSFIFAMESS
jgi:hypothetical protein